MIFRNMQMAYSELAGKIGRNTGSELIDSHQSHAICKQTIGNN